MEYEDQPVYDVPRPMPPYLWVGLTALFGLCCCFFFVLSTAEAVLLFSGYTLTSGESASASAKPAFGDVKFYTDSACSESLGRGTTPTVLTTTKAIYACFKYSNMKSGTAWSYSVTLNGTELPNASKTLKWSRDASGTYPLKLNLETPLKPGDYELILSINDEEVQSASFKVGP